MKVHPHVTPKRKPNHPVRLTVAAIEKYRPGKVRREIYDTGAPGLTLIIEVSGRKTFAFRAQHKKKTLGPVDLSGIERKGIPPIPSPHTLSQARAQAAALQQRITAGDDVWGAPTVKPEGLLYPAAVRQFIENERAVGARSKGWRDTARVLGWDYIDLDVEPTAIAGGLVQRWAAKATRDITTDDLNELIHEATTLAIPGRPARNTRHSQGRGREMAAALGACFKWLRRKSSAKRPWVPVAIHADLDRPKQFQSRDRVLTDQELKQVLIAAKELGTPWHEFVWTLFALGQRLREVSMMEWAELDKTLWNIPAARTKNARPHNVPLPPQVVELINSLRPNEGRFVFSTQQGRVPISGFSDLKERLDARVQIAPWRFHDARRTFVTQVKELGFASPDVIEAAINHVSGVKSGVAGVYDRSEMLPQRKVLFAKYADHLWGLVGRPAKSNVHAILKRAAR
jgi:integrase